MSVCLLPRSSLLYLRLSLRALPSRLHELWFSCRQMVQTMQFCHWRFSQPGKCLFLPSLVHIWGSASAGSSLPFPPLWNEMNGRRFLSLLPFVNLGWMLHFGVCVDLCAFATFHASKNTLWLEAEGTCGTSSWIIDHESHKLAPGCNMTWTPLCNGFRWNVNLESYFGFPLISVG